eukprot:COSAG01_NODE_41404_length_451_cov_73.215909_2_plen_48_part_01
MIINRAVVRMISDPVLKMSAGFIGILYYSSTGRYVLDLASKMGARCHA